MDISKICMLVLVFINNTLSQTSICRETYKDNRGKEFIVTVPPSTAPAYTTLKLYIGANYYDAQIFMTNQDQLLSMSATIPRWSVDVFNLDAASISQTDPGLQQRYIHITSDHSVAVYLSAYTGSVGSTFLVYPVSSLSTRYMVAPYLPDSGSASHIIVTAVHNDTTVNVTSAEEDTTNFTLDAFSSYNIKTYADTSGTVVTASKPVALTYGTICQRIPVDTAMYCDSLLTSPLPIDSWGKDFIVPPLIPRKGYAVRIFAEKVTQVHFQNNTHNNIVNVSRTAPFTLITGTAPLLIRAGSPVYVVQFGMSFDYDYIDGGPFETPVQPLTYFGSDYVFPAPLENFVNTLVITIRKNLRADLLVNNKPIQNEVTIAVPGPFSDYEIVYVNISGVNHSFFHPTPTATYGAMIYGRSSMTGYGFTLGYTLSHPPYTCLNGGTCGADKECDCPTGYSGNYCEQGLPETTSSIPYTKHGPVCLACDNVINMTTCFSVKYCQSHEICSIEEYRSATNQSIYSLGCKDKHACISDSSVVTTACKACCSQDFCNRNCTRGVTQPVIIIGK